MFHFHLRNERTQMWSGPSCSLRSSWFRQAVIPHPIKCLISFSGGLLIPGVLRHPHFWLWFSTPHPTPNPHFHIESCCYFIMSLPAIPSHLLKNWTPAAFYAFLVCLLHKQKSSFSSVVCLGRLEPSSGHVGKGKQPGRGARLCSV